MPSLVFGIVLYLTVTGRYSKIILRQVNINMWSASSLPSYFVWKHRHH